jgi:hypothetical protein
MTGASRKFTCAWKAIGELSLGSRRSQHRTELGEAAQARAERLIREALRAKGVSEAQLPLWPKGRPFKIQVAAEVRARTAVTVRWLAERLSMGTRGYLAHLLLLNARSKIDSGPGNQLRLEI